MERGFLGLPLEYSNDPVGEQSVQLFYANDDARVKAVRARLLADARFKAIDGKTLERGSSASRLEVGHLTTWWTWRANMNGIPQADAELENFLNSDTVRVIIATWVYGLNVGTKTHVADDIYLVPASEMPFSPERLHYLTGPTGPFPASQLPMARAALVQEHILSRIRDPNRPEIDIGKRQRNLALLINTLPRMNAAVAFSASYVPDDTPPGIWSSHAGSMLHHDVLVQRETFFENSSGADLSALLKAFEDKSEKEQSHLRRAIERLGFAKGRVSARHNQALDLGIALEMLLLQGPGEKQQLGLTLRLRGAWLLGNDHADRKKIHDILKKAYDLRSQVAHAGFARELEGEDASRDPYANNLADHMCVAEAIARKLVLSHPPNWDELVLGELGT